MKKLIVILVLLSVLCGCTNTNNEKTEAEKQMPLTEEYLSKMEDYEVMEVCLLGATGEEKSLDEILKRAKDEWGYKLIDEIDEEHIIFGKQSVYNYVYLLIPAKDTELSVGSFDPYSGNMKEIYHKAEDGLPFIYVEEWYGMDPRGIISIVTGQDSFSMKTGRNGASGQLRTDYLMGVVDITPYQELGGYEIGSFAQHYLELLRYAPMISDLIDQGYEEHFMDEMIYDGHMYMVYSFTFEDTTVNDLLYAVHYDLETNTVKYLFSSDGGQNWFEPDQAKG